MNHLTPPIGPHDHVRGARKPHVALIEYGDYECPHCARAQGMTKSLLERLGDHVLFVFRHMPLSHAHPHAITAALAAEAAGAQGHFWEMHERLFEKQHALELPSLIAYARGLDLDVARFAKDVENETYLDKVEADFRSGIRSGVNGTPTFFIDGQRFDGNWEAGTLTATLAHDIV